MVFLFIFINKLCFSLIVYRFFVVCFSPQVDQMVLVVPSVQVDVTRVDEQEGEEDEEDLDGVLASVHKVSVEHIGPLQRRDAILRDKHDHQWVKDPLSLAVLTMTLSYNRIKF